MIARTKVEKVIGKTFADKLDEQFFNIGELTYSRREFVEQIGCASFIAAVRLQNILKRLKITTVSQLHRMDPFSLLRTRGIGQSSIFVAMCILDFNGYDVMKWWSYKQKDNVVKFSTYKHHAARRAQKHKQAV